MKDRISDREAFFRSGLWIAISTLIAAALGAVFLAELRAGPIISSLIALAVYVFLTFGLPRAARRTALKGTGDPDHAQLENIVDDDPRVALLVEAHGHLKSIEAAVPKVPLPLAETLAAIVRKGRSITSLVSKGPAKLNTVLRFFTYYLPATADLVQDRIALGPMAGAARLTEIDNTLTRLNEAYTTFESALLAPDLQSVDMDIELLDKALDDDLRDFSARK